MSVSLLLLVNSETFLGGSFNLFGPKKSNLRNTGNYFTASERAVILNLLIIHKVNKTNAHHIHYIQDLWIF